MCFDNRLCNPLVNIDCLVNIMKVDEIIKGSDIPVKEFDGIIIGGGGAGMRASLQLAESGLNTAVISKVFPTRSHTVSAQGGITCAIASDDPDDDCDAS